MGRGSGGGGGGKGGGAAKSAAGGGGAVTIAAKDVEAFTANSKIQGLLYHQTTEANAASIAAGGINLAGAVVGLYGKGFYTATKAEPIWGPSQVRVAVDARKVLTATPGQIHNRMQAFRAANPGPDVSGRFSQSLRGQGYDAIRVNFRARKTEFQGVPAGQKRQWVVLLNPSAARIVQ